MAAMPTPVGAGPAMDASAVPALPDRRQRVLRGAGIPRCAVTGLSEALAEQGKATAVTVIRAGEQLPAMLTGASWGYGVPILLGRVGERQSPLLQLSFGLSGVPPALLHTLVVGDRGGAACPAR